MGKIEIMDALGCRFPTGPCTSEIAAESSNFGFSSCLVYEQDQSCQENQNKTRTLSVYNVKGLKK